MPLFTLALALHTLSPAFNPAETLAASAPVHLGIALRLTHAAEMADLQVAVQTPGSPGYHQWLTPAEFGARFGQSEGTYARAIAWLRGAGFEVTPYPSRAFLEASGTAAQVQALLGVTLSHVAGAASGVHVPSARPSLPDWLAPLVVAVGGLDTRQHLKHRLALPGTQPALGPQDLRAFYDLGPLFGAGFVGQGEALAVLSTAEAPGNGASAVDIDYFLRNVSDVSAPYVPVVLSNPGNDVDAAPNGGLEFDLDVQMQSVGAPGATALNLVIAPASEVFLTGAAYIASYLPAVTAVSVSLGNCEQAEQQFFQQTGVDEATALRQSVQQGTLEGQTWSAASGDSGSDDCQDGTTVSVDFPSSIPEIVAAGGTEIQSAPFDASAALTAWFPEEVWDEPQGGGAGGGGFSILFAPPPAQRSALPAAFFPAGSLPDAGRAVPDLALIAGVPGVAVDTSLPGQLGPVGGTSVASPLSAGFFALIASRVGCHLGDPHAALYALGRAQLDGGFGSAGVFHDLVTGNNGYGGVPGQGAGPGFDTASGWGSLDVAALANAWPPCATFVDGGALTANPDGGAYRQCTALACDAGVCTTLSEGPSSCVVACDPADAGSCGAGTICSDATPFSTAQSGACVSGCLQSSDCLDPANPVCGACQETCGPAGNAQAHIGDACVTATDCPSGGICTTGRGFDGGYCSQSCALPSPGSPAPSAACDCPAGSVCDTVSRSGATECLLACAAPGTACARADYRCQPIGGGEAACLPPCRVITRGGGTFDTCTIFGSTEACDVASGFCGGPASADAGARPDAGTDAGLSTGPDAGATLDAGMSDAGPDSGEVPPDAGARADGGPTTPASSGCGCTPGAGSPDAIAGLFALSALIARRRRGAPSTAPAKGA